MLTSLLIAILVPWIHGQEFAAVYSEHDVKLEGHVINSTSTSSLFHCMQECESTNNCHSINLYNNARPSICELNDANHLTNPESMVNSSGSTYLNYFPRPVSKCSNSLCRNSSYDCIVESDGINYKCKLIPPKEPAAVLVFPRKSTTDKVVVDMPNLSLTAFTVALWAQIVPGTTNHAAFQYVVDITGDFNEIGLSFYDFRTSILLADSWINIPSIILTDGFWHHVCLTWQNSDGVYKLYINGTVSYQNIRNIGRVIGSGTVLLGQEADSYVGGFSSTQSFQGNMTSVNMWNRVLSAQEVTDLATSCSVSGDGNIVRWSNLTSIGQGEIKLISIKDCV